MVSTQGRGSLKLHEFTQMPSSQGEIASPGAVHECERGMESGKECLSESSRQRLALIADG